MPATTRTSRRSSRQPVSSAPLPGPDQWEAFQQHLAKRKSPSLASLFPDASTSPLLWATSDADDQSPLAPAALVRVLARLPQKPQLASDVIARLVQWRMVLAEQPTGETLGLAALAWCEHLPNLAAILSAESWRGLVQDLIKLATDAAAISPADEPLAHQLLAVELPLTLAYLFPEIVECRDLARAARKLLSWGAEELTDGEGLPAGKHWHLIGKLLACWTRCIAVCRALPEHGVDEDAQMQFEWLLRQTLRLLRENGSLCFASSSARSDTREIITAALQLIDDPEDHALAKTAFSGVVPKKKRSSEKRKATDKDATPFPEPFVYSEWSSAGLLRGDWSLGGPRFAVKFDQRRVDCELSVREQILLAGEWTSEVTIDGWVWKTENDWEEVCWHTDEDVVYLEIETKLTAGWKVQRQMLLARKDGFVLLADAVLGEEAASLSYRSVLPLADGLRWLPADETREGHLANKRSQALVLPLALPEWRSQFAGGELQSTAAGLELTQSHQGRRLFAPLLIDLVPERIRKDCTWRQLTVAEYLQIQPRDVAVAFRAQVGKAQWSVYRSLAPKANRTFLGHNVVTECQIARFTDNGDAEVLLEIE